MAVFSTTFAALRYKNYRWWFFSQMVSFFGTWMQNAAQGFFMFEKTHSYEWLGYLAVASGIPTLLFMLYGGVLADRFPKRRIVVCAESAMMLIALSTGALIISGSVQPWHILVAAFLLGVANAFDMPARQSFVSELVPNEGMANAISLNSAMFNLAVSIGPAAGGIVYAMVGPGWCFVLNGISFLAVLTSVMMMRDLPKPASGPRQPVVIAISNAFRVVRTSPDMRSIFLLMCCGVTFGMALYSQFPAWATSILHGDATTNGYLQSSRGIGALVGALALATLGQSRFKIHVLVVGSFVYPVLLLCFGLSGIQSISFLFMAFAGIAQIALFNNANALIQLNSPTSHRGVILAMYNLVFNLSLPVGGLLAGLFAARLGLVALWETSAGISLILAFLLFLTDRQLIHRLGGPNTLKPSPLETPSDYR